jgi:hypothetical protein
MTPLSQYIITRATPTTNQVTVTIFDSTSYAWYQVYSDLALVAEQSSTSFTCTCPPNKKIDVLGLPAGEHGTDFNSLIDNSNGDKVELDLPSTYRGLTILVYSDYGTGTINYSRLLDRIDTTSLPIFETESFYSLTDVEFDVFTSPQFNPLPSQGTDTIRMTVTPRQPNGTYEFGILSADSSHPPLVKTQAILTRPDEIAPLIVSYDPAGDVLVLSCQSEDVGSYVTYSVYASAFGAAATTINFSSPLTTSHSPTISIHPFRSSTTAGTRYIYVRKAISGIEEKNWNQIAFVVANSDWTGNTPAAPTGLTGLLVEGLAVALSWSYYLGSVLPDGFHVYSDGGTGTINYSTPIGTVLFSAGFSFQTAAISSATKFGVRAYKGGNEEGNTNSITVTPPTGPAITSGVTAPTWRDV